MRHHFPTPIMAEGSCRPAHGHIIGNPSLSSPLRSPKGSYPRGVLLQSIPCQHKRLKTANQSSRSQSHKSRRWNLMHRIKTKIVLQHYMGLPSATWAIRRPWDAWCFKRTGNTDSRGVSRGLYKFVSTEVQYRSIVIKQLRRRKLPSITKLLYQKLLWVPERAGHWDIQSWNQQRASTIKKQI